MKEKVRKVQRVIDFDLTDAEITEMSRNAAELDKEVEAAEAEFKEVKKGWNEKIRFKKKQVRDILRAVNEGHQERDIECIEVADYEAGTITCYGLADNPDRVHDGVELSTRAMTEDEKQMEMDDEPAKTNWGFEDTPEEVEPPSDTDVQDVIKMETKRKSKKSSVDTART